MRLPRFTGRVFPQWSWPKWQTRWPRFRWVGFRLAQLDISLQIGLALALLAGAGVMALLLAQDQNKARPRPLDIRFSHQARVASTLNEAPLVPPPALPPELFLREDLPTLAGGDRDWQKLDSGFARKLLAVFDAMQAQGYTLALLEGYRSPERQEQLAAKGSHVTQARAFQSKHQYGQAADVAFLRNGRLVIQETDPWAMEGYRLLGNVAEQHGLNWGGRWKMMDFGHVESPEPVRSMMARQGIQ